MVNKAIVGILVLIVLTSLGVGVLIGTQLGGDGGVSDVDDGDASDGSTPDDGTDGTPTTTETTSTERTESATPTATATRTPTPAQTTISAREFDAGLVERELVAAINDERTERGLYAYETGTTTAGRVQQMARYHSQALAAERSLSYGADGNSTSERYEQADLFSRCRYQDPDTGDFFEPDNDFQSLGRTVAGQEYDDDGETRFNGNESQVAQAIAEDWFASTTYRRPLVERGPNLIGVGVTITDGGEVYASAAICD